MGALPISIDVLKKTKVGKVVNVLAKTDKDHNLKEAALRVVNHWKIMVNN
jgi:hypothetical protein